jgi:TnpA family transposase
MLELGRAQKTIFIARYLRDRDLQRETNEGLNLIEAWNRVNTVVIFCGKSGDLGYPFSRSRMAGSPVLKPESTIRGL